ncbi:unnamed protein product [Moneuplotes crassus]|uniref:Tetratricopeptide repeat protein n=1 Tax=Euplotes crassus TaxID=5936 RepID=A0AAD1UAM2_EUPCR|nr:unnamed protein product [Moneuplotes crassus]
MLISSIETGVDKNYKPKHAYLNQRLKESFINYILLEDSQKTDYRGFISPDQRRDFDIREEKLELEVLETIEEYAQDGKDAEGYQKACAIALKFIEDHTDLSNYQFHVDYPEVEGTEKEKDDERILNKIKVKEAMKYAYSFNAYFYLGLSQYELEKYLEASASFEAASRFTPHNSEVYYYKAMSYLKGGKYDDCKIAFRRCLKYDKSNIGAASNLSYAYNISGFYDSAIKVCEDHINNVDQNAPEFYMYLRNWTYALIKEKFFVDAIVNIRKAIEINPRDPENWVMWGTVQKINGDFSSAKNKFEIALKIEPNHCLATQELYNKGLDVFISNISEV